MIVTLKTLQDVRPRQVLDIRSMVVTLEETIGLLAPVIDQPGWQKLDVVKSQVVTHQDVDYMTQRETTRCDTIVLLGDGSNTVEILDWVLKSRTITKDPEIRILGPDAESIFGTVREGLVRMLPAKILEKVNVEINEQALKELAALRGLDPAAIVASVKEKTEEFRMLLKAVVVGGALEDALAAER